jgi:glycosyltransferase involved in cell wall biosynthesis
VNDIESILRQSLLLIPAFNEEQSIGPLLAEIRALYPYLNLLVINDASTDRTLDVLRREKAPVLNLPCNLGIGGAMQAGLAYAFEQGWRYAIRCDGDGQHPPSEIPRLVEAMRSGDADLVIGSRFLAKNSYTSTAVRSVGIRGLAVFLAWICRAPVTDPTSGFQMVNRLLMGFFARSYPLDYPEPESLSLLRRQGYTFKEVGTCFRARTAGRSSIGWRHTWYYAVKVALALVVDRARPVDVRYARHNMEERL